MEKFLGKYSFIPDKINIFVLNSIDLLKKADIVVTNPPFPLFISQYEDIVAADYHKRGMICVSGIDWFINKIIPMNLIWKT